MKKSVIIFSIFLLLVLPFATAGEDEAIECLNEKIGDCSSLNLEEQIFSLLAVSKCKAEILEDSEDSECWPQYSCEVKPTAQAIFALGNSGTLDAEDWLLEQDQPSIDLEWYLQIDSDFSTVCEIVYDSETNVVSIDEDKKIDRRAGRCLSLAEEDYWLEVEPSCYETEFEISCNEDFSTSLLYKKKASSEYFVSKDLQSTLAEGILKEKVNSLCFKKGSYCDYESTLWAALALKSGGKSVDAYLPYLISMAEENQKYLPDSFLSLLTTSTNYQINLLSKQKENAWDESGDKFYDTAVALLALQDLTNTEKTNALDWLIEVQDEEGCWKGNLRNTAFLLYSGWGEGQVPSPELESCSELEGIICDDDETCDVSSVRSKEGACCLGECEEKTSEKSQCEVNNGICRTDCRSNEKDSGDACDDPDDDCCVLEDKPQESSYWYIWVLMFLIILVVIGITFKDKLRIFWFRIKSGFGKAGPSTPKGPGPFPPTSSPQPTTPRRVLPPRRSTQRPALTRKPRTSSDQEFADVLKKLKEMGGG